MEDIVKSKFVATKESCMLTSLGYAMKYFANKQGLSNVCVEIYFGNISNIIELAIKRMDCLEKNLFAGQKVKDFQKSDFQKNQKP